MGGCCKRQIRVYNADYMTTQQNLHTKIEQLREENARLLKADKEAAVRHAQDVSKIVALEGELAYLRQLHGLTATLGSLTKAVSEAKAPEKQPAASPEAQVMEQAEQLVRAYYSQRTDDPTQGKITINGERYVLLRGASLSVEFFQLVSKIYDAKKDDGEAAHRFLSAFLFDLSHNIGKSDSSNFSTKMNIQDPVARLLSGPINFAYAGWSSVSLLPGTLSQNEDFCLEFEHPNSFEADSYLQAGIKQAHPVCTMNCGYSSGWCEEAFGIPLVTAEILCQARGDGCCRFIMAPPDHIARHVSEYKLKHPELPVYVSEIPGFFERRRHLEVAKEYAEKTIATLTEEHTALTREREKVEKLLRNILPAPIATMMKEGQHSIIADTFPAATVLFADVCGFTQLCNGMDPRDVIHNLNAVFSKLDVLAERYGLEKIKTIGDCYMVACGVPKERADHQEAIACFALEVKALMDREELVFGGEKLLLRLGFHSGPIVGGVVGKQKFTFELWGDAVNTAQRMEAHGDPGKIQVTQEVYNGLVDRFVLSKRGVIMVKGKGTMTTYWLEGRREGYVYIPPSPSTGGSTDTATQQALGSLATSSMSQLDSRSRHSALRPSSPGGFDLAFPPAELREPAVLGSMNTKYAPHGPALRSGGRDGISFSYHPHLLSEPLPRIAR